jgi:hypothetical protein
MRSRRRESKWIKNTLELSDSLIVERRYCGPPNSGNGGYVCGLMARFIDGAAEVTLRSPPLLERPLAIETVPPNRLTLWDGETIVAEAGPTRLELDVPDPPTYAQAQAATRRYRGFDHHPFPTCFVCGPERSEADGLRIFPGLLPGREGTVVAASWVPDDTLVDPDGGYVRPEFLWAALDCPGYYASLDGRRRPMVLGRMVARLEGVVRPGERCVVVGWSISRDGRKGNAGTALYSESGELIGRARTTWIEVVRI